jgi:soluble lytic murein transglycosylase-like protein
MQLMPGAAREVGVDRFDLRQNIQGGAAYLSKMVNQFGGDLTLGLAAYNAGPEAVRRWGGVPPYAETRAYVAAILDRLAARAVQPSP